MNVEDINDASVSGTFPMFRTVRFKSSIFVAAVDNNAVICK